MPLSDVMRSAGLAKHARWLHVLLRCEIGTDGIDEPDTCCIDCNRTCTSTLRSDQSRFVLARADAAGQPRTCASIAALQRTQIYQWALVSGAVLLAPEAFEALDCIVSQGVYLQSGNRTPWHNDLQVSLPDLTHAEQSTTTQNFDPSPCTSCRQPGGGGGRPAAAGVRCGVRVAAGGAGAPAGSTRLRLRCAGIVILV